MSDDKDLSMPMHYTLVIALIISLITTFLLGMLLTELLFNTGLGYFHEVSRQAVIEKSIASTFSGDVKVQPETPAEYLKAYDAGYLKGLLAAPELDAFIERGELDSYQVVVPIIDDGSLIQLMMLVERDRSALVTVDEIKNAYNAGFMNALSNYPDSASIKYPYEDRLNSIVYDGLSNLTAFYAGFDYVDSPYSTNSSGGDGGGGGGECNPPCPDGMYCHPITGLCTVDPTCCPGGCIQNQHCDIQVCACVPDQTFVCQNDADCGPGMICNEGLCAPFNPVTCEGPAKTACIACGNQSDYICNTINCVCKLLPSGRTIMEKILNLCRDLGSSDGVPIIPFGPGSGPEGPHIRISGSNEGTVEVNCKIQW